MKSPPKGPGEVIKAEARFRKYRLQAWDEIAAPLPPLQWLCRGLKLARGTLTIVGGYGYSRKTLYAQSVALAVSSGKDALGVFRVEQTNVLHIDYEQGDRISRERYQRLARASGVTAPRLTLATFPHFKLTDKDGPDVLRRMVEESGAGLVIIDSLRAAVSGVDENSSEIRECLDLVAREVKRVEAAAIVIHHARKPSGGDKPDGRYSLRGSGAIFDACEGVFIFSGEKNAPTLVEHDKERLEGSTMEPFGIDSEDVEKDGDPRWGLRLVHLEPEQMRERSRERNVAAAEVAAAESLSQAQDRIVRYLVQNENRFEGSRSELIAAIGINRQRGLAALTALVRCGSVSDTLTNGAHVLTYQRRR